MRSGRSTWTVAGSTSPTDVELEYTVNRDYWPAVGAVLPAHVHLDRPERTEIIWERVPKNPYLKPGH